MGLIEKIYQCDEKLTNYISPEIFDFLNVEYIGYVQTDIKLNNNMKFHIKFSNLKPTYSRWCCNFVSFTYG